MPRSDALALLLLTAVSVWSQRASHERRPSENLTALQWKTGERWPATINVNSEFASLTGVRVETSPELSECGIVLILPGPETGPGILRAVVEKFLHLNPKWVHIPVYSDNSIEEVATNEMIVRFKSSVSEKEAKEILIANHMRILTAPTALTPRRYLVRVRAPVPSALEIFQRLRSLVGIQYVEVNYVVVKQPSSMRP